MAPTTRNYPAPNVLLAEAGNPWEPDPRGELGKLERVALP